MSGLENEIHRVGFGAPRQPAAQSIKARLSTEKTDYLGDEGGLSHSAQGEIWLGGLDLKPLREKPSSNAGVLR